ncbi:MAG: IS66 family transposase [Bacteroidales bacterium]|nr:IS66 family transposase [Bacteroidales bacterium]
MITTPQQLPDDVDALKEIIADLKSKYEKEIQYLEEKNNLLLQKLFGRKSEKITPEDAMQGRLFDEAETFSVSCEDEPEEGDEPVIVVSSHTRKKRGRKLLPESLPRVDVIHDIPEEEKHCACGCEMKRIGEEVSEKLDIIPQKIQVLRHIRYKYACKNCEGSESEEPAVKTAPLPLQIIPKGIATPGLLAWVLVSKFCDAIPFYRQEKLFARIGVELSRATFCNWALLAHKGCSRLLELMMHDIISSPLVGMDETTVQVMNEKDRKNTTKSYMWISRGATAERPVILFRYNPTRGEDFANSEFKNYAGIIQTDGYAGYNTLGKNKQVTHAGCWAHVRRKFVEASTHTKDSNSFAHSMISMIKKLYDVESEIREKKYNDEKIIELRDKESRPVVEKIGEMLEKHRHSIAPKSLTGKAITYTIDLWPRLSVYLDNSLIPIDNNLVENAIRPFVVGRKNWLFSGSPDGAHASAAIYSIIETAKANGLEPYWYLRYLFEKLPACKCDDEIRLIMPNRIDPDIVNKFRGGVD